jgi:hypothetical protein
MNWNWLAPWRRAVKPDTSERADELRRRVESQKEEVADISRELQGRINENHFRLAWEDVIRGGPS